MKVSIFRTLQETLGSRIPSISLTKATLVHLSHTLEDFVLTHHLPAVIFTGFQESSHWRKETERYRQLADVALQVTIFAGNPLPEETNVDAIQVTLDKDDPLRQEWFLAIFSGKFNVILCGLDNLAPFDRESHRRFDTLWSFDSTVINAALDVLENVIAQYRPDVLPRLQQARRQFPPVTPGADIILTFTQELLAFEDRLNRELADTRQSLNLSGQRYESIVTHAPVVTLVFDRTGVLTTVKGLDKYAVLLSIGIIEGQTITELSTQLPLIESHYRAALDGRIAEDVINMGDNGHYFDVRTAPLVNDEGIVTGVICVLVDVTARQAAEKNRLQRDVLQVSLDKERELNEMRRQLMLTLSHEMRTPLALIQSASDLLSQYHDRLTPDKRKIRLESIQIQVARLKRMMDDIDIVVRSETQQDAVELKPVDFGLFCEGMAIEMAIMTGREIICHIGDNVGQVSTDTRIVRYIVSNLLSNALKYSDDVVHLDVLREDRHIQIQVRDYGLGIPEDEQTHILAPFSRGSNVNAIDGTGLGLSIVANSVRTLGGTLAISSQLDVGTTVTATLPVRET